MFTQLYYTIKYSHYPIKVSKYLKYILLTILRQNAFDILNHIKRMSNI